MSVTVFGDFDGVPVLQVPLQSDEGAQAEILTWGAAIRDLRVPHRGRSQRVVLGLNSLADYRNHSGHMGAVAGRFANRIANASFALDGVTYNLPRNLNNRHSLHGGGAGFGVRPWRLATHDRSSATLTLHSPDGDAGYPGALDVSCTYRLLGAGILRVEFEARCDAPTIINLAQHSYFNLDGSADARGHEVLIPSKFRTPTDAEGIPTGEIRDVTGTAWDFTRFTPINARNMLYDSNYVVTSSPDQHNGLAHAATLRSPLNGLSMEVHTSAPCVQFYDAANLACPGLGLENQPYQRHAGICFEPQGVPDAPNQRQFPSAVLRPGETYRQTSEFRFG